MIWLSVLVGAATGILSGMGIGGGSLLILYLTAVMGADPAEAARTNLLYFLCCAPSALYLHIRRNAIAWDAVRGAVPVGLLFSVAASLAAGALPTAWLHRLFGILMLYVGIRELRYRKKT